MEDYIKHIRKIATKDDLNPKESLCGEYIMDWAFLGIDHAYLHREHDDRLLVCKKCIKVVNKILRSGY